MYPQVIIAPTLVRACVTLREPAFLANWPLSSLNQEHTPNSNPANHILSPKKLNLDYSDIDLAVEVQAAGPCEYGRWGSHLGKAVMTTSQVDKRKKKANLQGREKEKANIQREAKKRLYSPRERRKKKQTWSLVFLLSTPTSRGPSHSYDNRTPSEDPTSFNPKKKNVFLVKF